MLRLDVPNYRLVVDDYTGGDLKVLEEILNCKRQQLHLTSVDTDGYCGYCGHQEGGLYIEFEPPNEELSDCWGF